MSTLRLPKHLRVALLILLFIPVAHIQAQTQAEMNAADTGLSSLASRNGLAAYTDGVSKMDIMIVASRRRFMCQS